jgi:hypothetical protein
VLREELKARAHLDAIVGDKNGEFESHLSALEKLLVEAAQLVDDALTAYRKLTV